MITKDELDALEEDIRFCEWARERTFKTGLYEVSIEWDYEIELKKRLLKRMKKQFEDQN